MLYKYESVVQNIHKPIVLSVFMTVIVYEIKMLDSENNEREYIY